MAELFFNILFIDCVSIVIILFSMYARLLVRIYPHITPVSSPLTHKWIPPVQGRVYTQIVQNYIGDNLISSDMSYTWWYSADIIMTLHLSLVDKCPLVYLILSAHMFVPGVPKAKAIVHQ